MASRIEDYGIIGNMRTAALVSRSGSIDWLCAPNFDSDACFAGLVGYDEHGHWAIRPAVAIKESHLRYESDALVLVNEIICEGGVLRITDFMPPDPNRCDIVRIVEGVAGEVPFEMTLNARFGYGANAPWIRRVADGWTLTAGPDALLLRTDRPAQIEGGQLRLEGTLRQGEQLTFQLCWYPSHEQAPAPLDIAAARATTADHWTQWAGRCVYRGAYRDAVVRSLLTLKALSYAPTGAIVAAPTAGLPEEIGGVRNWDYRFCWMRDASLTLHALMFGGYVEEAMAFRDWVLRAVAGDPAETQIMYDIRGGRRLTEMDVPWLPGYEGSKPVRIGNAASDQFQLDIYGETLSALYASRRMGLPEIADAWPVGKAFIEHVARVWQRPDDGVWEVRGGRRHFTYSKVMAWVAIDRAVKLIEEMNTGGDDGRAMLPRLRALRERIHEEVCERGFNRRIGAFTQFYGGEALDASVLLMTHMGFLPAEDPRIQGTVAAIEKDLVRDGFVLRYSPEAGIDGLPGSEGAFLACSFWLADNYAFAGRIPEAEALFQKLLDLRSPLGLLAEEYEPRLQRQIGNFPQGFSHLALVTTARIFETIHEGRAHPTEAAAFTLH
jgi:GH15 family glucan-1,4-alpha-glucosidase